MIKKMARIFLILWMMFSLMGCSSLLTYYAPLKSKLVDGEKIIGEFSRYNYNVMIKENKLFVEKEPLCKETVMKYRSAQKERRCFSCSLVEMVFYGFGFFDMLRAYAIVEDSKKIEPLAEYETGNLVACGKAEPAANESLYIDNKQLGLHRIVSTDASGVLDLEKVLYDISGAVYLRIHLESKNTPAFKYLFEAGHRDSSYSEKKQSNT